ncbi:ImcF-related family protein [Rhodobacter sp. NSM]|uniref:ImcF-related family protein n=1 Tax=Rhodobacter sp. NSM TaxID=3457501 RepID=UPI003FD58935
MPSRRPPADHPFDLAAAPVFAFAEDIEHRRDPAPDLATEAGGLLDRFADEIGRAGTPPSAIAPARYALALLIDRRARANRSLDLGKWGAAAGRRLFDGRDLSEPDLRSFIRSAAAAGPVFEPVRAFLESCLARIEARRTQIDPARASDWRGIVMVLASAFVLAVAAWALHVEWTFHRQLSAVFAARAQEAAALPLGPRLDALAEAAEAVATEAGDVPLRLAAGILRFDAVAEAEASYGAEIAKELPPLLAHAIDDAIASEAEPASSYDTVRAWAILSGWADWSPVWLAGWLDRRASQDAALRGLDRHVLRLDRPAAPVPQPDPELLAQARGFAASASEAERAWLELLRSDGASAIPAWRPDVAIPEIGTVLFRRSGEPLSSAVPGLFTAKGWDHARERGAGLAVQAARRQARLFDGRLEERNDTADRVLALLQAETIARWSALLADLRVVPFRTPDTAVQVSGELSRPESPLTRLLREVWREAGGEDPLRPHELQLKIAAAFGPTRQFIDRGGMNGIAGLFAGLNVALGSLDRDSPTGLQRLMRVEERARSITTLRQAPAMIVQIIEDLLAQAGAAQATELTNPLTRAWQAEVLPACRHALDGRYPFAKGPDADPAAVAGLLGPGGAIPNFVATRAASYLDTGESPWRWKPEARFAGLSQESAAFLERASAIGPALSAPAEVTLTALAERGTAVMALGGQGGPVTTTSDSLRLAWPGARPEQGARIDFRTPGGEARLAEPGPWGLLRLLEPFRLRERDGGRRFLIDLRSGGARLFVEAGFASVQNPLAMRRLARGLACPPVL